MAHVPATWATTVQIAQLTGVLTNVMETARRTVLVSTRPVFATLGGMAMTATSGGRLRTCCAP
jgi:hypothetical protein